MFLKLIINYSAGVKYRTGSKSSMVLQIKALWESLSPSCKLSITRSFAIHWSNKFLINILLFLWNATSSTSYSVSSSKLFVVLGFFYLGSGRRNTASSLKAGQSLFDKCLKTAKKRCLFSKHHHWLLVGKQVCCFSLSFQLRFFFNKDFSKCGNLLFWFKVHLWCRCRCESLM